jgi:uncharacterized cupredoxin-like copper-binding protein
MAVRTEVLASAAGLAAVALAGCGGGGDGSSATTASAATTQQKQTTAAATAGGSALTIKMSEFAFDPKNPTAAAGKVKVTAPNIGKVEHELVLFKTNREPGSFKVSKGRVNEEALEHAADIEEVGEIADVEPGETKSETFKLTPGKYVMICNVSGHYKAGMYGSITVQ